ncbi:MAG: hypothetical protein D6753_12355 [Planctomycetota bacterium]|nr:MAG: hypothetical protein D6753_12355 [Planctomycetota bacterium]
MISFEHFREFVYILLDPDCLIRRVGCKNGLILRVEQERSDSESQATAHSAVFELASSAIEN